ncbi:uncharacterized protein LOC118189169 [Stegodyphus dumicola]|uniref:uncharacterized protein LOC118189169 n=1 Tax=Stegodyphus dumicola TaxID=202533 RepID=UPI0015AAF455|nr:uncharacterized protein LOC118189169 [Stegodyphus dumicola]
MSFASALPAFSGEHDENITFFLDQVSQMASLLAIEIVASDQGTNFTASLNQVFLERIGSSPRFSTPYHTSSNGLAERFNAVLKGMIHHTIREHSKDWKKHLPYLLWAYREVPNAATGVSSLQMLYGRRPNGPLSILTILTIYPDCHGLMKLLFLMEFLC